MDNLTQEKSKDEIKENGAPEGKSENPIVIEDDVVGIHQPPSDSDDNLQFFFLKIREDLSEPCKFNFDLVNDTKFEKDTIKTEVEIAQNVEKNIFNITVRFFAVKTPITYEIHFSYYIYAKKYFMFLGRESAKLEVKEVNEFHFDEIYKYNSQYEVPLYIRVKFSVLFPSPKKYSPKYLTDYQISMKTTKKIGIANEGNTCYMNTIIQSMFNLPILKQAIMQVPLTVEKIKEVSDDSNPNMVYFVIQKIFYKLSHSRTPIKIVDLFKAMKWERNYWNVPQDACEIYMIIYEKLSSLSEQIKQICEGEMQTTIQCTEKEFRSKRSENFLFLSLDIGERDSSLDDMIESFFAKEDLTGDNKYQLENEDKSYTYVDAVKWFSIKKPSQILFVHLKRFNANFEKNYKEICFRPELDLTSYSLEQDKILYELYCVIVHDGNIDHGHYFAYVNDMNKQKWYEMNDKVITEVGEKEVYKGNFGGVHVKYDVNPTTRELEEKKENNERTAYILIYVLKDKIEEMFKDDDDDKTYNAIQELIKKYEDKAYNITPQNNTVKEKEKIDSGFSLLKKSNGTKPPSKNTSFRIKSSKNYSLHNNSGASTQSIKSTSREEEKKHLLSKRNFNSSKNKLIPYPFATQSLSSSRIVTFTFFDNRTLQERGKSKFEFNGKKITTLGLLTAVFQKLREKQFAIEDLRLVALNKIGLFIKIFNDSDDISQYLKEYISQNIYLVIYIFNYELFCNFNLSSCHFITSINFFNKNFQQQTAEEISQNNYMVKFYPYLLFREDIFEEKGKFEKEIQNTINELFKEEISNNQIEPYENEFKSNGDNLTLLVIESSDSNIELITSLNSMKYHELNNLDRTGMKVIYHKKDEEEIINYRVIGLLKRKENSINIDLTKEE